MNAPGSASGPEEGAGERALALVREARQLGADLVGPLGGWCGRWLGSVPRAELLLAALLALVYVIGYLGYPALPGNAPHNPIGWWAWHDQDKQLQAAKGLASLHYGQNAHHYPPGYALLAAPFVHWMPNHPFFIADLLLFVGIGLLLFRLARLFLGPVEAAGVLAAIGWLASWELQRSLIVPWSTIPTHFIAYLMIWLYLTREKTARLVWQLALLDGLAYLCRPGDAAFLAPMLLGAVLEQAGWRKRARAAVAAAAVLAVFPAAVALLNVAVTGSAISHYEDVIYRRNGFFTLGPLVKAYLCFLDGLPIYRYGGRAILERLPWLVLFVPGTIWFVKELGWRRTIPPLLAVCGSLALYMGYNSMSPISLYPFSLIHYITWTFPLFGLMTYLSFRKAWRALDWPALAPAFLLPLLLVSTVRLVETDAVTGRVADDGRVVMPDAVTGRYDLVVLRGLAGAGPTEITVAGTPLRYSLDYHRRRDYWRMTFLGGYIVHLREAVDPRTVVFPGPYVHGSHVEFRRLRWAFEPLSPLLRKLLTGSRDWGVDELHRTLVLPAHELSAGVGAKDLKHGTIRTTGKPGTLQYGPYIRITPGRYLAEWHGTVQAAGRIIVDATAKRGDLRFRDRTVHLNPSDQETLLAQLEFDVRDMLDDAELRLHVDDAVSLTLTRVVLRPRIPHDY